MTGLFMPGAAAPEIYKSMLQVGIGVLIQSSLLLALGLLAGRVLQSRGPALQSLIYRATMGAVATSALASVLLAGSLPALWSVSLPPTHRTALGSPVTAVAVVMPPAAVTARPPAAEPTPSAASREIKRSPGVPAGSAGETGAGRTGWAYMGIAGVWLGGTALLLVWLGLCHLHIQRLRLSAVPVRDGNAATLLWGLCGTLRVRPPLLLASARVHRPFLTGLWRPAILLPAGYESEFDGPALRAILIHELAHVARWDCAWNLLARTVCAALWMQPIAWILAQRMEHTSEEICDQKVLELENNAHAYADCLLRLAERLLPSRPERAAGMGVVPFRSSLGRRVAQILDRRQPLILTLRGRAAVTLGAAGAVAMGVHLVSAAPPRPGDPAKAAHGTSAVEKPAGGPVSGRVITPDGGPVAGATVSWISRSDDRPLSPASVRTDAAGRFRFADTTPFRHKDDYPDLMVEAAGWGLSYQKLPEGGEPVVITVNPATTLRVRFVDQEGKPAPDLKVTPSMLFGEGGAFLWLPAAVAQRLARRTDANGAAAFPSLPQGHQVRLAVDDERFAQLGQEGVLHLSSSPASQAQPIRLQPGASIQGRITFGPTGQPAVGIKVGAQGMAVSEGGGDAVTDARGEYRITQLRSGAYNVALGLTGVRARSWTARAHEGVTVHAGERVQGLDFQLVQGAVITGRVVAEDTGAPIPGIYIGIYGPAHPQSSAWVQSERSAADGTYLLRVPNGKQYLYMSSLPPPGFLKPARESQELTVRDGETVTVDFRLRRGPRVQPVHGRVLGPDGQPVGRAEVWITSAGPGGTQTVETDAAGRFVLSEQQLSQTVTLHARHGDLATPAGTIVTGEREVTLRLRRDALASLAGRVTDPAGRPVAGAQISLIAWAYDTGSGSVVTQTDPEGRYTLPSLWPDLRYSVSAAASGFGHKDSDRMELKPGEAREVPPLVLQVADRSVAGRVVDEKGDPLVGAQVDLDGRETASQMKASESEGRFRFDGVVNEKVSISAQFPGYEWTRKSVPAGSTDVILVLTNTKDAKNTPSRNGREEQEHFAALRGQPAPPLRAVAWINAPPRSWAQLRGKVVLIDFWATGCGPCVADLPGVQRAADQFTGRGVVVIGLHAAGSTTAELRKFAQQHHLTDPLAIDAPDGRNVSFGRTFREYAVEGIPSVAVIDREGRVAYMGNFVDEAVARLGPLLAERPHAGRGKAS